MNCSQCNQGAAFLCLYCSNIKLCLFHFADHLARNESHKFKKLTSSLEDPERSILNKELSKRLSLLKSLKDSLTAETSKVIKTICDFSISQINTINNYIQYYRSLQKKTEFISKELEEIRNILNTNLKTHPLNLNNLTEEVKKFYSHQFLTLDHDLKKQSILIEKKFLQNHSGSLLCLDISNDGSKAITGSSDTTLRIWDVFNKVQIACLTGHKASVSCVTLSRDSSLAISGSHDKSIRIWDLKKLSLKKVSRRHLGPVSFVKFTKDEDFIITGSFLKEIFIWGSAMDELIEKISLNEIIVSGFVSPKNELIIGTRMNLYKYNLETFSIDYSFKAHDDAIGSIVTTESNKFIISGSKDCLIKVWDNVSMKLYSCLGGHSDEIISISVTSDDTKLVSSSQDMSIILWHLESGSIIHKFTNNLGRVWEVQTKNDLILSVSEEGRIGVSKISTKKFEYFISVRSFTAESQSLKGQLVAFGRFNDIIIWDFLNDHETVLKGHSFIVSSLCLSSNKKFLISCSFGQKNNVILWDLTQNNNSYSLNGHHSSVLCVDISENESFALTGDDLGYLIIWNITNFSQECIFQGHTEKVTTVKISHNQCFAASAGNDKTVIIWNIRTKNLYTCFYGHQLHIEKVFFTEDDKFIVSIAKFEGFIIWSLDEKNMKHFFQNLDDSKEWLASNKDLKKIIERFV